MTWNVPVIFAKMERERLAAETARADLFERLLARIVADYHMSSDGHHRDSPVYCEHCGTWVAIRLYSDAVDRRVDHAPDCLIAQAERALGPRADHAALLREMEESDETS